MPDLTLQQIFGSNVSYIPNTEEEEYDLRIDLNNFRNSDFGGDITTGLGVDNPAVFTTDKAVTIFYALMLLILQNQADRKSDDPEQKIHITEAGVSVVTSGARKGQLERRFFVSFFKDEAIENSADIDSI